MTGPPQSPSEIDRDFARYRSTRDPEALGRVFDATASKLLLVAMHLVRDAAAAEDVVQATFLAAMRNVEQYDPARPVLPWLTGILTHQASVAWRERYRRPDPDRVTAPPPPDPARTAEVQELAAEVSRVLDGMPSPYRQVLVLHLVHGLRNVEIARALERSPETVRSQMHRGLELLRKALPRGLAVPALALAAAGAFTGRGLAAVRAAVHAEAGVLQATAVAGVSVPLAAVWFGGSVLMQKLMLSAVGAICAALLLWTLWPGSDSSRATPVAETRGVDALHADKGRAPPGPDLATTVTQRTPAEPAVDGSVGLKVQVIDARSGKPEPGAEVLSVLDLDPALLPDPDYEAFTALESVDPEAQARRFGQAWRTGADGIVTVPRPRKWSARFIARSGGRYGYARWDRDRPDVRLELEDDRWLRVRVAGPDDAPCAEVMVALALHWRGQPEPTLVDIGTTDMAGMVIAPHTQVRVAEHQLIKPAPPEWCAVVPRIPALVHTGVRIDLAHLPDEPIVIRIPATGRIAVELVDADGAPTCERFNANLEQREEASSIRPFGSSANTYFCSTDGVEGRIVFPHVGLGARFAVTTYVVPEQVRPGPRQPREEVVFRFALPAEQLLVRGRALDAAGEPLRQRMLKVSLEFAETNNSGTVKTDADGVFRYRPPLDPRRAALPVQWVQVEVQHRGQLIGVMARMESGKTLAAGPLDLGDVALVEAPLIAAGTLVDDQGGFANANLEVRPADTGPATAQPPPVTASVRFGPGDRFAIRGWVAQQKLVLTAGGRDDPPIDPVRFDRGADDLHLVLRRKGRINVTVLHDLPFEQAQMLQSEVVPEGKQEAVRPGWSAGPSAPGRMWISLSELAAGRYTLHVRIAGDPHPLATISDIEVGSGAVQDPRLSSIDLRGRFRLAQIRVIDASGSPIRGEGSLLLNDRALGSIHWVDLHDDVFVVPIATQPIDATIRVSGFRHQELKGIDGDRTVHLEPQIELSALLTPGLVLPAGVTLHAFARVQGPPADFFGRAMRSRRGPMAGSGEAAAELPEPGRFQFRLSQADEYEITFVLDKPGHEWSVALPATPAVVTIKPMPRVQEITFTTDAERIEEALRELMR